MSVKVFKPGVKVRVRTEYGDFCGWLVGLSVQQPEHVHVEPYSYGDDPSGVVTVHVDDVRKEEWVETEEE